MGLALQFRRMCHDDLKAIDDWFDDVAVQQFIGERGWASDVLAVATRERLEEGTFHREVDVATVDGAAVALVDIEVYVDGWAAMTTLVDPGRRRQGVARECLQFAIGVAREHGAARITAFVELDNAPSIKLLESLGFVSHPGSSEGEHSWSLDLHSLSLSPPTD